MRLRDLHREAWLTILGIATVTVAVLLALTWPFETLSRLAIVAAIVRGGLIVFVFACVGGLGPKLTWLQRAALGLTAATMTLTVQSLLVEKTPYELWAAILSGSGLLVFFGTWVGRDLWDWIARLGSHRAARP